MKLSSYLENKNMSYESFAEMVGTTKVTVYRYLNGSRKPSPKILKRIIIATNGEVTPNDFFDFVSHQEKSKSKTRNVVFISPTE